MESVAPSTAPASPAAPESFSTPAAAARALIEKRSKAADSPQSQSDDGAEPAAADETELPDEGNAAAAEAQPTGETEQEQNPDSDPPIPLPRSWTKEQAEHWNALPRATQEYLTERDSKTSAEVRRLQNEAADRAKAHAAEVQKAEQARTEYEQKAREALDILAREQQRDFADIKTIDDVTRLASTDPLRYIQWQAHQTQLAAIKQTVEDADKRKADASKSEWNAFQAKENALAIEAIPDLGDKVKGPKLMEKAVSLLQDIGFTPEDLGKFGNGEKLSLFDHRVQRLIFDGIRYRDLQSAKTVAASKPVPQVARPGTKQPSGSGVEKVQALSARLSNSGSLKDALALRLAKRSAASRTH